MAISHPPTQARCDAPLPKPCSRLPLSLRRTKRSTSQSLGALRPRWLSILSILWERM